MKTNHWFFLLVVPLLWSICSLIHFQFPGDEYSMWLIDSMAGSWALRLAPNVGDIHQWWFRFSVAGSGTLVMAVVGWILCRLKVRKRIWTGLWAVSAMAWLALTIGQFMSLEQALAKNGSFWTYLCSAAMMAAYAATLLALAGAGVKLLKRKFSKPMAPSAGSNPAAASP